MKIHTWNPSTEEGKRIQSQLRKKIIFEDYCRNPKYIAGADVGFNKEKRRTKAAIVIFKLPELEKIDQSVVTIPTTYPYIPGLLSFREAPALLKALDRLTHLPDVILYDSQGYAHPRRFGLACHMGVLTGIPAIGVAKSKLIGKHRAVPGEKGNYVSLTSDGEQIGIVLRSRDNVNPIYVSVGHKITLNTAKDIVMQSLTRYRLPETTRAADKLASFS